LIARYISKTRLSRELKRKPEDVHFQYSTNGKPLLGDESDAGWWFSLSHCAGAVVCAIADRDIGVDVESLLRCEKLVAKSGGFFSPAMAARVTEVGYLPSAVAFAGFWTCLEAQVKLKDSSIFSERRIFELVPDISGHYGNNQDINLMAVTIGAENIISIACRCDFEMNIWLPEESATSSGGLTWQPAEQNAVELLFRASGNVKPGGFS
jgi:phosphopantetheinyl transferase